MPAVDLTQITVGGPCKVTDGATTIYFEDAVKLTPNPTWRKIPSSVSGGDDDVLVDLTWTLSGRPMANIGWFSKLLPSTLHSWSTAGGRVCGNTNNTVTVVGADSKGFTLTRACVTKMPELFMGIGGSFYSSDVEWTAFIGQGKALTDADAFYTENTTAWSQSDYPSTHEEQVCTATWGAVTGWTNLWATNGFKLTHELSVEAVKSGNITVDRRITGYRAMVSFTPEQPTSTQLLTALALQGASGGIGTRRSDFANDFVVTGDGFSLTVKSAALNKGNFIFDNKANRHGEFGMVSSLAAPGARISLA